MEEEGEGGQGGGGDKIRRTKEAKKVVNYRRITGERSGIIS